MLNTLGWSGKSFPMFEESENIRLVRLSLVRLIRARGERMYIEKVEDL